MSDYSNPEGVGVGAGGSAETLEPSVALKNLNSYQTMMAQVSSRDAASAIAAKEGTKQAAIFSQGMNRSAELNAALRYREGKMNERIETGKTDVNRLRATNEGEVAKTRATTERVSVDYQGQNEAERIKTEAQLKREMIARQAQAQQWSQQHETYMVGILHAMDTDNRADAHRMNKERMTLENNESIRKAITITAAKAQAAEKNRVAKAAFDQEMAAHKAESEQAKRNVENITNAEGAGRYETAIQEIGKPEALEKIIAGGGNEEVMGPANEENIRQTALDSVKRMVGVATGGLESPQGGHNAVTGDGTQSKVQENDVTQLALRVAQSPHIYAQARRVIDNDYARTNLFLSSLPTKKAEAVAKITEQALAQNKTAYEQSPMFIRWFTGKSDEEVKQQVVAWVDQQADKLEAVARARLDYLAKAGTTIDAATSSKYPKASAAYQKANARALVLEVLPNVENTVVNGTPEDVRNLYADAYEDKVGSPDPHDAGLYTIESDPTKSAVSQWLAQQRGGQAPAPPDYNSSITPAAQPKMNPDLNPPVK